MHLKLPNIRSEHTDHYHIDLATINMKIFYNPSKIALYEEILMPSFQQFHQIIIVDNIVVVVLVEIFWLWFLRYK